MGQEEKKMQRRAFERNRKGSRRRFRSRWFAFTLTVMCVAWYALVTQVDTTTAVELAEPEHFSHQRSLQDFSFLDALDGPRCGAESHMKKAGLILWIFSKLLHVLRITPNTREFNRNCNKKKKKMCWVVQPHSQ